MIKSLFNSTKNRKKTPSTWFLPWNSSTTWLLVFSLLIILLLVFIVFIKNFSFDLKVIAMVNNYIMPGRTRLMSGISFLGNFKFLAPAYLLLIFYFIMIKDQRAVLDVSISGITGIALLTFLKDIIHRNRPAGSLVEGITNFSFPSGHALMSVIFYGLLMYWGAKFITNKWLQGVTIFLLVLLILLIGISRIYLKVHYLSDVLAGWCIGLCLLLIILHINNKIDTKYFSKKQ